MDGALTTTTNSEKTIWQHLRRRAASSWKRGAMGAITRDISGRQGGLRVWQDQHISDMAPMANLIL